MREPLNLKQAHQILLKVVEGREDHIYEPPDSTCVYWDPFTKQPSCIVGHLLYEIGVSPAEIEALDHNDGAGTNAGDIPDMIPGSLTPEAATVLGFVQAQQDTGTPWGDAVRRGLKNAVHSQVCTVDDATKEEIREILNEEEA